MPNKPEKVNLVETPHTWDEIVSFCERASTPSDATIAALMAWNLCVDCHYEWNSTKRTSNLDEPLLTQEERDALTAEMNNDGC
jgi:hypothetical protein